jgi:ribosome-associated protein
MAATSSSRETALEAARLIADHKGDDTVVLDISEVSGFADFFIIATAHSSAHVQGLLRELTSFFHMKGIHPLHPRKGRPEKGWILLDCGDLVIHLMEKDQREFYDLEKLWFRAERVSYWSKSS